MRLHEALEKLQRNPTGYIRRGDWFGGSRIVLENGELVSKGGRVSTPVSIFTLSEILTSDWEFHHEILDFWTAYQLMKEGTAVKKVNSQVSMKFNNKNLVYSAQNRTLVHPGQVVFTTQDIESLWEIAE